MSFARYIDHTLLKADATPTQIETLCREARTYRFAAVCVNSAYVPLAKASLSGSGVKVCSVVGFPLGAMSIAAKLFEAIGALEDGADEIDMVINIGRLKSGGRYVETEIRELAEAVHEDGQILKVIIETCLLTDEEKQNACLLAKEAGADFVKTSTGFGSGGATVADVALMRAVVGPHMGVKASGGISDYMTAKLMIAAGATRIGTSKGVAIELGSVQG